MADPNKTEKATPKRKKDERKKGNVFKSKDISSVVSLVAAFIILYFWGSKMYEYISKMYIKYTSLIPTTTNIEINYISILFKDIGIVIIQTCGIMLLTIMVAGVLSTGVQTKFLITKEKIKPKLSNINPISGIKKMFSIKSLFELFKNMLKIIVLIIVTYKSFDGFIHTVPKTMSIDTVSATKTMLDMLFSMVKDILMAFFILAVIDLIYSWWEHERNLRMTKQEIKDEYKEMEGDPKVKGQRKQLQRSLINNRMMSNVPDADVIIKNPTHFAVAIKYKIGEDSAPVVVAKGKDYMALKILEIAKENNINTMENIPLARALYKNTEVGMEISIEYYEDVAEILAWVYRLEKGVGD